MSEIIDLGAAYDKQFERVDTPRTDALIYRKTTIEMQRHELLDLALALERELAEARKDAERYRWLRDNTCKSSLYEHCGIEGYDTEVMISGEVLEAAIDAAMKEGEK
jgi:HEPN domain-containing protein